ncbi:MAG TPA: DUF4129 domain-containing protein [Candidatus Bathyarchaeia archaeon]|nr:DUF4129 domain-containing protein [Candidatus Bathyarchaeia archaeon]
MKFPAEKSSCLSFAQVRMHRSVLSLLVLLSVATNPAALGQGQPATPSTGGAVSSAYDRSSFTAELRRIAEILKKKPSKNEMAALRDSLPKRWTVSTPEGSFSVSSEPLRNQLTSLSSEKTQVWVNHLAEEVAFSAQSVSGPSNAREELNRILARSEFAAVKPPSAWDLFRQRLAAWVERMLLKLLGGAAKHPLGGQILFWLLIVVAVGVVAMWVFRFFASRDRGSGLAPSTDVTATRTWQEWIREAREAAGRDDFREAVHSAYWAGIARLEDLGVVPKDRTKTPREYLKLVDEPADGLLALEPVHREPLSALTRGLERIWYANRGARLEDFRESLRLLEALGCLLE